MSNTRRSFVALPFTPCLAGDVARQLEEQAMSRELDIARHMALSVCARDSHALMRLANQKPRQFDDMLEMVRQYQELARSLGDAADTATARMLAAWQAVYTDDADPAMDPSGGEDTEDTADLETE